MQLAALDSTSIFKSSIHGVLLVSKNLTIKESNEVAKSLMQTTSFKGKKLSESFKGLSVKKDSDELQEGYWRGMSFDGAPLLLQYSYQPGVLMLTKLPTPNINNLKKTNRFGPLFESNILGLAVLDLSQRFCDINKSALDLLGYSKEELIGKKWDEVGLFDKLQNEKLKNLWPGFYGVEPPRQLEIRIMHKNGHRMDLELSIDSFSDYDNHYCLLALKDVSIVKKTQEDLNQSQQELSNYMNNSPLGIIEFDVFMRVTKWSSRCEDMFGWKAHEVLGTALLDFNFVHVEDLPYITQRLDELNSQTVSGNTFKIKNYTKEGEIIHCAWHNSIIQNENGQVHFIMSLIDDVTKSTQLEQALLKSENELRLFFDNSIYGFFFMMLDEPINWNDDADKDELIDYAFKHQKVTRINRAMLYQYRAREEEFVGLTPADFFEHDLETGKQVWKQFFDQGHLTIDTNERRFDGEEFWVEGDYKVLRNNQGWIIGHFGVQHDVTNRKKAQQQLVKNESKIRHLIDHASDCIFINNLDGHFIDANKHALEKTGYSLEELQKLHITEFLTPESQIKTPWRIDELKNGKRILAEREISRKDGTRMEVEVSSQVIDDQILAIVRDITERKASELKLKENQKLLREVGRIARVGGWQYHTKTNSIYQEPGFNLYEAVHEDHHIALEEWLSHFGGKNALQLAKLIELKRPFDVEIEITRKLEKIWVRIIGQPELNEDSAVAIQGIVQDITDQKKHKRQILHEKELSDTVINNLPGVFYLYNQEGQFLRWNDNFSDVTGYSAEQIAQMHPTQFFDEDDHELLLSTVQSVFENGYDTMEAPFVSIDGIKTPYFFTGSIVNYGGEICLQGVGIDISETVEARKSLENANIRLKTAQQIAHLGYWEWDLADNQSHWSEEVYAICGQEMKNGPILQKEFVKLIHPEDLRHLKQSHERILKTHTPQEISFRFHTPKGELRYLKSKISPVINVLGQCVRLEGTLQDKTTSTLNTQKLKIYNERFNIIAQTTSDAIFEWNPLEHKAWWSDSLFNLFEFDAKDGIPSFESWLTKIRQEDQHKVQQAVTSTIENHQLHWKEEIQHVRKDGSIGTLLLNAHAIKEKNHLRILGGFVDVSKRKEQEELVRKSNERYELIAMATNDAIWDWDMALGKISGNDNFYRLYNVDSSETIADDIFFTRIHPDDLDHVRRRINAALIDQEEIILEEYRFLYPDQTYRIILDRAFVIYDDKGLPKRMLGAMQDITELRESENELQSLNNRHILATTSAQLGIFDWSIDQDKLVWNEFMYLIFDVDPSDFDHSFESWLQCLHPRDVHKFNLPNQVQFLSKSHISEQLRVTTLSDETKHIEIQAVVLKNDLGEPNSVIGVCRDITETVNSEQEITRAIINTQEEERFQTGQELHDSVIQVLVAALMNLNLAVEQETAPNKMLKNGLSHIKDAIRDIRSLSHRMAPSNLGGMSLEESIRKLINDMNNTSELTFHLNVEKNPNANLPDDLKLNIYRIFQEQLNNIFKHSGASEVYIDLESNLKKVYLRVKDNGRGFEPSIIKQGIGLNNIRRRVKVFNGEILIKSTPNKGCDTIIEIPIL